MLNQSHLRRLATWMLRLDLAFSFLSAVADRSGLWGQLGTAGWGRVRAVYKTLNPDKISRWSVAEID